METETNGKAYITFNDKMIASTHKHSDPTKIDKVTGNVMEICAVKLPSADYRNHHFEPDANGLDRDNREATINVVKSYIFDNKDKEGNVLNHFTYLDPERLYNVNFKGKITGQENGKNVFDKPEKLQLSGAELTEIYKESRIISKEKKIAKEAKNVEKEPEKDTAKKAEKAKAAKKAKKKTEPSR